MADQQEPSLPVGNNFARKSVDLLPRYYRTDANKKFLSATVDQLTQKGTVRKLNGFIGRQNSKAVKATDIFVTASDTTRQNYQLEPAAVIKDEFDNITFYKDYLDYINQINVFGGNVDNHERLNQQEFYSWNPHICWDKFVNFQNYYWLPYGPDEIIVAGQIQEIVSTYTVNLVNDGDSISFLLSPDGLTRNPTITLFRGQTYRFEINSPDNPFSFKTARVTDTLFRYSEGVTNNGITNGVLTFTVGLNAPDVLFYCSETDPNAGGAIHILDVEENTFLDVEADIVGKKTYSIVANNIELSNGMKIKFLGRVTPEKYSTGYWYVEGVGAEIKLISESELEIIATYSQRKELIFDDTPFDIDPFSTASAYPVDKDYITINRSSPDRNQWSRYNRWFHQDVIIATAKSKNQLPELDQNARANRAIIEFNAGLKLFNFGYKCKNNVDLIDNFTTDVFSTIEGSLGYNIDGVDISDGMRILFTADTDNLVKDRIFRANFIDIVIPSRQIEFDSSIIDVDNNIITCSEDHQFVDGARVIYINNGNTSVPGLTNRKIYYVHVVSTTSIKLFTDRLLTVEVDIFAIGTGIQKLEVFQGKRRQINLVEESDSLPVQNEIVVILQGERNQGYMYHYTGSEWKLGQIKNTKNQPPLFDLFDENGFSFADATVYDSSTFIGSKLFSYKVGLGNNDSVLGFPLTYKNINNIGDIVFDFNLLNDTFTYKIFSEVNTKKTDTGFLKIIKNIDSFTFKNGWTKSEILNVQPIIRIFKNTNILNDFPIDVYDDKDNLQDLEVKVLINGLRLGKEKYQVLNGVVRKFVRLDKDVKSDDVITLKCYAKQKKNKNGYYEIPINLQNNPLNNNLTEFTLGEVIDHVGSIIDNAPMFQGEFPGNSNLRDLADLSKYGLKFLQHSGPLNFSLYHLTQKSFNIVRALEKSSQDYGKFKRAFITAASNSEITTDARRHVDYILEKMNKDLPKSFPYYLTDMFGFLGANRLEYTVVDTRVTIYPITSSFNLDNLGNKAVYVYLNEQQLIYQKDYEFGDESYINLLTTIAEGDKIQVFEYETTDASFCPPTPTKLGLYPKYEPKKYIDNTYLDPVEVIQGHDGSITLAYGDYRDDMLLELEKRIFNNIKINYDPDIFNIYDFIPGYDRQLVYNKTEVENVMGSAFFQWTSNINKDFTKQTFWDADNSFTFNYRSNIAPNGSEVPAFWRGIYKWFFDTDRPHTHPWECLGFTIKPKWWNETYGPEPFTKNNEVLWDDLRQGIIREPGKPIVVNSAFARSILSNGVPTDENGDLVSPLNGNFVTGYIKPTAEGYYVFGDQGPVETAWRRSSYYPFALIQTALLLQPNKVLGTCLDRSRIKRNLDSQLVYKETNLRTRLQDIVIPSTVKSTERIYTSGLINYIVDYVSSDITSLLDNYVADLQNIKNYIGSKLGGFTTKSKFKILLDSKSPTSTGGVFVPEDNYKIFLNTSSPIKRLNYSAVAITKFADGYEVRGYIPNNPYFIYYPYRLNDRVIRVGGISESFVFWQANKTYVAGKIVNFNSDYYRVKTNHESSDTFNTDYYTRLAELPQTGGREIQLRKEWDYSNPQKISYGTKFSTIQEVADFIQGYAAYLEEEGFVFDQFNPNLKAIVNWETSIKEFLFWTTQNWAEGSAISLSPGSALLVINSSQAVINDIKDPFYGYNVFKVDGELLESQFANISRDDQNFSLRPINTNHGIFGAVFYMIQKEHVLLIDNSTLFNDIIYDVEPGYRQERIKILGYISSLWNGGFNVPGFIFDDAKVVNWESYIDYNLGDVVKYKEFYYSAKKFTPGTESFESSSWYRLQDKPELELLPNWDYKAEQFNDFYDLDTDNFDTEQQRIAQHLIGYQNRQYLENIIKDDVSQYKFYQGMITEKGTQNVLTKLFDVLSADDQDSLSFNEEWAVRVGDYGAIDSFNEIEFKLDEKEFKLNPQPFELVQNIDPSLTDFVYRQSYSNVYIKPIGYDNNPFPTNKRKKYLRTPGYVHYEDVKLNVNSLQDAVAQGVQNFNEGDYVWCAFENRDWNVYRFTKNTFYPTLVEYDNNILTITCNKVPDLIIGDIIAIKQTDILDSFYTIKNIIGRKIIIEKAIAGWTGTFTNYNTILTFKFVTSRIASIDNANDYLPPKLKNGELLWADDNGLGFSTTYENNKVFQLGEVKNVGLTANYKFGSKVSITENGNIAAVTTNDSVLIFNRTGIGYPWLLIQTITPDTTIANLNNLNFGQETAFSQDGEWLAIAAPTASNVKSKYKGYWQDPIISGTPYNFGDVVTVRGIHFSLRFGSNDEPSRFDNDWSPIYLVSTDLSGTASVLNRQGYVNIYQKRQGSNQYNLVSSFISPYQFNDEKFGSKLEFAKQGEEYVLAVSSPGYNNNQGRVYMFRYGTTESDSTVSLWKMDYNRNYAGVYNPLTRYYAGDIVFRAGGPVSPVLYPEFEFYRCLADQDPTPMETNPSAWEVLEEQTNILGFFPQQVVDDSYAFADSTLVSPSNGQNVESVLTGSIFGYDVRMTNDGQKLVISAPGADHASHTNYKGRFRINQRYDVNDVVYYLGFYYACKIDFEDNSANQWDPTQWRLLDYNIYDPNAIYNIGDIVYFPPENALFKANTRIVGDGSSITPRTSVTELAIDPITGTPGTYTQDWDIQPNPIDPNTGKVFVYEYNGEAFVLVDTLGAQNLNINTRERFGESIAISSTGNYLAVSSILTDEDQLDQGRVLVFESSTSSFIKIQDLFSIQKEPREQFGTFIDFMNDDKTLVVFSVNGDVNRATTFDANATFFDSKTLKIVDVFEDTGRIDIFDRFSTNFIYGETLTADATIDRNDGYGKSIAVGNNTVLVGALTDDEYEVDSGKVYSYTKPANKLCWQVKYVEKDIPNVYKIKKAFLYNRIDNQIVRYLDVVDPIQGKIPGIAEQEIRFKTFFDPAFYSVGNSTVNVDTGLNWTNEHKGMLWWDLTNAKFLEFAAGDVVYRNTTWNTLYETASIDIYEWVESKYLPNEWDSLAGTEEGFTQNISGTSKYGNTIYSVKQKYDTVSKSFINTYYYWVKNPTIIPNVTGRSLTASDVSRLISDPIAYGYKCLALLGKDSFSLINVDNELVDTNIVLSVQYWMIDNQTQNYHSHWKIIGEDANTKIPYEIENKWINSLIGKDDKNRLLPNYKIPAKLRYGIENRPRQSMFVNRLEALKQFIERVNTVLKTQIIVDDFDISDLTSAEIPPSNISGEWDKTIDFETELRFIGTAYLEQAIITPIIHNGRIIDADIVNPGYGYVNAPYVKVVGNGVDAVLKTIIDENGRLTSIEVLESGNGYDSSTKLEVRPFRVLVNSDSTISDRWAIYSWNTNSRTWSRSKNQSYNVNNFWKNIDWYLEGYNQFNKIDYVVENTYELTLLQNDIGSIVKVKNVGSGGWMLLEKIANTFSIDYSQNYKVIGRQNGTIEFLRTLYTFEGTNLGYSGPLFDSDNFDEGPSIELRIILSTIKDKIFVENLRIEYIKLFFASLRYVLKEQLYVDWAFKTSFVKATHHAGDLKQKVNYNSDSLQDYENYIKEVKPYRTKVREYISAYNKIENASSAVTDFDLVPYINDRLEIVPVDVKVDSDGQILSSFDNIESYPWKFWYDNIGYKITEITVTDPGSGYIRPPVVRIIGGFGSDAEAVAYITNGKVTRIQIVNSGKGYLKAPTILLDGGLNIGGVAAKAIAIINESVVRSNKITVKFDRITRAYYITELEATSTFTGTGSRLQWPLPFSPKIVKSNTNGTILPKVTINGIDVLRDDFTLTTKKSVSKGYTSYSGLITFITAPPVDSTIVVIYEKDFNHLSAADRINFYYNVTSGKFGKDLAQLMTGIDFGGVNISGLGFTVTKGWDSLGYLEENWDGFDATFDDETKTLTDDSSTQYEHELNYIPAAGTEINVYLNGRRIDDAYFNAYNGVTVQPNGRKVAPEGTYMQTWVGDGINNIIALPNLTSNPPLNLNAGDVLVFRKSTSDGSFIADPDTYDTQLSAGNLAYTTATGFSPDDIVLDGEGFITPAQSYAPEEVIPGHISDALAVKVFRLPNSGSSKVLFKNYVCNGVQNTFNIGQYLQTYESVIVKLNSTILEYTTDYTYDYTAKTVTLNVAPASGDLLSVLSFSIASDNILDSDTIVTDGQKIEYVTNAPWPSLVNDINEQQAIDRLGVTVLLDGNSVLFEVFKSTGSDYSRVGLRFGAPPALNSLLNYIITDDANASLSIVKSEQLAVDGSSTSYALANQVGNRQPYASNVLVIKNGELLSPGETINYKVENNILVYMIPSYKLLTFSIGPADVIVSIDGNKLDSGEYLFDASNNSVTIEPTQYVEGAILSITLTNNADYFINSNTITFANTPVTLDNIEIISFYLNDTQKIIRSNERFDLSSVLVPGSATYYEYMRIAGGHVRLFRTVPSDDYVWVAKNKQLLSHSIDYYLDEDLRTIRLVNPLTSSDKFDIIIFNNDLISNSYGFMQFKDMLNRVHYKRINKNKATSLTQILNQKDREIFVTDGSVLSAPNVGLNLPGIIEINGERIEYFVKAGNTLSQLRRGTLGTGIPTEHRIGSQVLDIGRSETIPYSDQHIVETFISDGSTNLIPLNYSPNKAVESAFDLTKNRQYEIVELGTTDWNSVAGTSGVTYAVGSILTVTSAGTGTGKAIGVTYGKTDELDIFVGGLRLKKNSYQQFDLELKYPESPEGDKQVEAGFSVSGSNNVRLTLDPPSNSKIVVIKKVGKVWGDPVNEPEIYRNVPAPYGGATFDVQKNKTSYSVSLKLSGAGYNVGDVLILSGLYAGGDSPENDITITVVSVTFDSTQSIVSFNYTGTGRDNGYTYRSLLESNNNIANFIKNTETILPNY